MKLNELTTLWLAEIRPTVTQSTVASYEHRLGQFIEWLGSGQPTRQTVAQWFNTIRSTLSARTVHTYRQTLHTFFKWAVESKHVRVNPVGQVKNLPIQPTDRTVFTTEQYQAVRHQATGYWQYAVITGWHTGLRLSDVAMLKWAHVDFARECLVVTPRKTSRFGKTVEIPMSPELFQQLATMRLSGPGEYVSPEMATHYQFDQHKTLSMQFGRLVAKAGVTGVSFHSLRGAFITRLLEAGNSPALISTITGQTVEQVMSYARVGLDAKRKVMGI